ncbi:MAG: SprT family zinc-dependent metalloprotease [Pseudomonadota bacterium]
MPGLVQLTLDFFAASPRADVDLADVTQSPTSALDAVPSGSLASEQVLAFRHPQASREVVLSGVLVAFAFRRGKRRTIGFSVGAEGLAVSAPKWVTLAEVDKSVRGKTEWILRKLYETRDRHHRLQSARIDWQNGAQFPFVGGTVRVELDPRHAFAGVGAQLESSPPGLYAEGANGLEMTVRLGLPHNATAIQIRDSAQAWLMREAKLLFTQRLEHYAPQLGVTWRRLSLSSAGTRWGTASADGSIRLNWRLVHFGLPVIDYVVVHELSHLRVMDHSPAFWETVRSIVPSYPELRRKLKDEPIPQW